MTVGELLQAYADARLVAQRRGASSLRSLRSFLGPVLLQPAGALTGSTIEQLVLSKERAAPVHAQRALGYVSPLLSWAVEQGHLSQNPLLGRPRPKPSRPRDRILSLDEVRRIWWAAADLDYPFGPAIRLLILVPTTREIVGRLRVSELMSSPGGELAWGVPGDAHPRRLSSAATQVVREALDHRRDGSDFLFSMTGSTPVSGWSKAKRKLDALLTEPQSDPWRLNDLRSSFAALARDHLGVDRWVIERCLGRVSGFFSPLLREWSESPEIQREADEALAAWAELVTAQP